MNDKKYLFLAFFLAFSFLFLFVVVVVVDKGRVC